ncbi:MAG: helix-turn-helix transcriptional regulator [Clostridiales bacterium]|nr:helix-turn-helix transcriptional regulator [Clostridiales bacterium]
MFKNKTADQRNNLCGLRIRALRKALPTHPSQQKFAAMLQLYGLDMDKNAIQRIESGARFVTDIELAAIAKVLGVSADVLLGLSE